MNHGLVDQGRLIMHKTFVFIVLCQAYYYFNEVTQESSWEPPPNAPETYAEPTDSAQEREHETPTALSAWNGVADDSKSHDAAVDHQSKALLAPFNNASAADADHTFPFFVNERGNRVFCVPRNALS